MHHICKKFLATIALGFVTFIFSAIASDRSEIRVIDGVLHIDIILKNHNFEPNVIEIPAGQKIKLIIHNQDDTAEEFESFDLKREKIIPSNSQINIILAPLKPGQYKFFGDFYPETAQGVINVK